jgi:acetyl-CoA carboxylase biotin carboxyl carrier protein
VYFSASPGAPAFVEDGAEVRAGQVVALIEVMKFFYEVKHEGAPARVLRRAAADAAPVEAGAALYWLAPLG